MTVKVKWFCDYNENQVECYSGLSLLSKEPEPLLKNLSNDRRNDWLRCPAVHEFCKNTFVIRNPFYYQIKIDFVNETKDIFMKNLIPQKDTYQINQNLINLKFDLTNENECSIHSVPRISFFAKYEDSVEIETLPAIFHRSMMEKDILFIPGKFNISKWIRPINFTFAFDKKKYPLLLMNFEENEPLFYVRFHTKNNEDVEFEYIEKTPEIKKIQDGFLQLKTIRPNFPLKICYEYAKKHLLTRSIKKYFDK